MAAKRRVRPCSNLLFSVWMVVFLSRSRCLHTRKETSMSDLLQRAIAAHGGLDRFNQFQTVSAHLVLGGRMWVLKGQEAVMSNARIRVTVDLHREYASLAPFQRANLRTAFTPQH